MKLIEFTAKNGNPLFINPDLVVCVGIDDAGRTRIDSTGVPFSAVVKEDVGTVVSRLRGND